MTSLSVARKLHGKFKPEVIKRTQPVIEFCDNTSEDEDDVDCSNCGTDGISSSTSNSSLEDQLASSTIEEERTHDVSVRRKLLLERTRLFSSSGMATWSGGSIPIKPQRHGKENLVETRKRAVTMVTDNDVTTDDRIIRYDRQLSVPRANCNKSHSETSIRFHNSKSTSSLNLPPVLDFNKLKEKLEKLMPTNPASTASKKLGTWQKDLSATPNSRSRRTSLKETSTPAEPCSSISTDTMTISAADTPRISIYVSDVTGNVTDVTETTSDKSPTSKKVDYVSASLDCSNAQQEPIPSGTKELSDVINYVIKTSPVARMLIDCVTKQAIQYACALKALRQRHQEELAQLKEKHRLEVLQLVKRLLKTGLLENMPSCSSDTHLLGLDLTATQISSLDLPDWSLNPIGRASDTSFSSDSVLSDGSMTPPSQLDILSFECSDQIRRSAFRLYSESSARDAESSLDVTQQSVLSESAVPVAL